MYDGDLDGVLLPDRDCGETEDVALRLDELEW